MKRKIWILAAALSAAPILRACEVCGCAPGSGFGGLLQSVQGHFMGIRLQIQPFTHPETALNQTDNTRILSDIQWQSDLWARWQPHARWQFLAQTSFRYAIRKDEAGQSNSVGLGDTRLMAFWKVAEKTDTLGNEKISFRLGAGIQLPTGSFRERDRFGYLFPMGFQPGNGSFGYSFSIITTRKYNNFGWQADAALNGFLSNPDHQRQGMQAGFQLLLFQLLQAGEHWTLLPQFGAGYDWFGEDQSYGIADQHSGGHFLHFRAGIDVFFKKMLFQLHLRTPVFQQLPESQPRSYFSAWAGVAYRW